jgi:hypothetical protein
MKMMEGRLGGKRVFNTTVFQPVMPVQLSDRWKVINRPVFLFQGFETPGNFDFNPGGSFPPPTDPFSTQAGLGDIGLIQWLSNSPPSSKMVTGFGWNWMFPAATFPDLGTGRTSLGPSFVGMYLGEKIITGGIVQQYWSIDNRQDREHKTNQARDLLCVTGGDEPRPYDNTRRPCVGAASMPPLRDQAGLEAQGRDMSRPCRATPEHTDVNRHRSNDRRDPSEAYGPDPAGT